MKQNWVSSPTHIILMSCLVLGVSPSAVAQSSDQVDSGARDQRAQKAAGANSLTIPRDQSVTLAFRDVEISDIASAFSTSLGFPILLDGRVKGRLTLEAPQPVRMDRAYELFASALSLQGFALVPSDGFARILPATEAKGLVPPIASAGREAGLTTRVFVLRHESATQMSSAIRALVPAANAISVAPGNNSLIISDTAENLSRIAEIIAALDKSELGEVRVVNLTHVYATDHAQLLNQLVNTTRTGAARAGDTPAVTFLPDTRSNRLILRGFDKAKLDQAERLAKEFDLPLATPGNVHVLYLKNADASKLALTLQGLYQHSSANASRSQGATASGRTNQPGVSGQTSGAGNPSSAVTNDGQRLLLSGLGASPAVTVAIDGALIQAEPTLNALLVVAAEPVFRQIRGVVEKLDVRRAQVFIESLIVEVSADRAAEFGVQFQYLNGLEETGSQAIGGTNFSARGAGTNLLDLTNNPLSAAQGLNIGVIKGTVTFGGATLANLGVLARALETKGNGNIIATPTLMTLDNEEAKIVIGQNVPFITGSFTTNGNTSANPFQTIERRDVGTTLRVKPLITEGGTIRLQIFQEVSSVNQRLTEGIITNKRAIESTVLVNDEQIVVLGGLIQDQDGTGESRVPGLGSIPLLGNLFRYETRERKKTNLFVFIRPVVIRTAEDSNLVTMGRYESIRATQAGTPAPNSLTPLPNLGRPVVPEATDLPGRLFTPSKPK